MKVTKLFGPPGTGKTSALLDIMEKELEDGLPPERLAFLTFTRKARKEAVERTVSRFGYDVKRLPFFRTLHANAYAALNVTGSNLIREELADFGELVGMEFTQGRLTDSGLPMGWGNGKGDKLLEFDHLRRHRLQSAEEAYKRWDYQGVTWWEVEKFTRAYREWKLREGLLDFTDLLDRVVDPLPVDVVLVDEAQDLSRLQWRALWRFASKARRVYIAGDDDQCQPPGTMVTTPSGPRRIEDLRDGDVVVTWDRSSGEMRPKGKRVRVAVREYTGDLCEVMTWGHSTLCTPDHRWTVRWSGDTGNAVYLMRQGTRWRVGWCQIIRADGVFHVGVRARMEKADAVWVLQGGLTKTEASVLESTLAAQYGIPTVPFHPVRGAAHLTAKAIDAVFHGLNPDEQGERAQRLLTLYGRDVDHPLWSPTWARSRRGGTCYVDVVAANLLPGVMCVPEHRAGALEWTSLVAVERRPYHGPVYSLSVDRYPYYVADGLLTHNCIFTWAGADEKAFMEIEGEVRVLGQSWRLPRAVHSEATRMVSGIVRRQPKEFRPREEEGRVDLVMEADHVDLTRDGSYLILYRNHYLAEPYLELLRQEGLPYATAEKGSPGAEWGPSIVMWERLRKGGALGPAEVRTAMDGMRSGGPSLARGAKTKVERHQGSPLGLDALEATYGLTTRAPWYDALDKLSPPEVEYIRRVLKHHGTPGLLGEPRVHLSTIHAAKGGEADHVILVTDVSGKVRKEIHENPDAERRVFYVGITRARQTLTLVGAHNPLLM